MLLYVDTKKLCAVSNDKNETKIFSRVSSKNISLHQNRLDLQQTLHGLYMYLWYPSKDNIDTFFLNALYIMLKKNTYKC